MRAQIRGLSQASRNVQDGISLIQLADGGMQEIHNILHRQRELAVKALNGIYSDGDRAKIQMEIKQLTDEIDRIAYYTEFNTIKVLCGIGTRAEVIGGGSGGGGNGGSSDGIFYEDGIAIGPPTLIPPFYANDKSPYDWDNNVKIADMKIAGGDNRDVAYFNLEATSSGYNYIVGSGVGFVNTLTASFSLMGNMGQEPVTLVFTAPNGEQFSLSTAIFATDQYYINNTYIPGLGTISCMADFEHVAGNGYELQMVLYHGLRPTGTILLGGQEDFENTPDRDLSYDGTWYVSFDNSANNAAADLRFVFFGINSATEGYLDVGFIEYETWHTGDEIPGQPGTPPGQPGKPPETETITHYSPKQLWIQSGPNSGDGLWIDLYDCRVETLGLSGVSVSTYDDANQALGAIDKAVGIISGYRATAGSQQNRLEHTMRYLGIAEENLTDAESRIRDADMAKEMMALVKNNILMSAAQAMLAQANMMPQSVLKLLK